MEWGFTAAIVRDEFRDVRPHLTPLPLLARGLVWSRQALGGRGDFRLLLEALGKQNKAIPAEREACDASEDHA